MAEKLNITERGFYNTRRGHFVEVIDINEHGMLVVNMHDGKYPRYMYHPDGMRSINSDDPDTIIGKAPYPTAKQLKLQLMEFIKWRVQITKTETHVIEVEARGREEAKRLAQAKMAAGDKDLKFMYNEANYAANKA